MKLFTNVEFENGTMTINTDAFTYKMSIGQAEFITLRDWNPWIFSSLNDLILLDEFIVVKMPTQYKGGNQNHKFYQRILNGEQFPFSAK